MDTLQVSLFFLVSYLISRVFVKLKIPELVVYYLIEKRHISIQKLTLIIIIGSTLISTIILNVITVLTLMPLVILLQKEFKSTAEDTKKFNTLFLLSVLWGANIGGLGMITGTTTNGILIGLYDLYKIPVGSDFTFISWAAWGLPLAILLSVIGWLVLILIFKPGKLVHKADFSRELESAGISRNLQKKGFYLAICFILTASILSYLLGAFAARRVETLVLSGIWTVVFLYLFFLQNWISEDGRKTKLLVIKDILHNIPKRGLLWMAIAILITYLLWQFKFHRFIAEWFVIGFSSKQSILSLYWIFALLTIFLSEIVSNTAVQFSMFVVLFPMIKINPQMSWQGMLIITLCSSCAFMTPIATPSNGLGFGSSGKVSLKYMLLSGFVMNIVSAVIIVAWVVFVVPMVLRFF